MSKSPAVVAAIGIAGCLALSLIMRSALDAEQQRRRDPLEMALEEQFGAKLSGPAKVRERELGGKRRLVVELQVLAGLQKQRLIEAAGRLAWQQRWSTPLPPDEVEVVVRDDGDGDVASALQPPPRLWGGARHRPSPR